jgi:hypothetical protein
MRLSANFQLNDLRRSSFAVTFQAVDVASALSLFWPEVTSWIDGTMDAQLRGNFGTPFVIAGSAAIHEGSLSGLAVRGVRLPVQIHLDPLSGRGLITASNASGQIGGGRVAGRVEFDWSSDSSLAGDLKFYDVDLPTLLRELEVSERYGSGSITGRLTLTGRRVKSIRDVTGTLRATLRDAQAMSFPVLQQMRPYLSGGSGATTFEKGEINARLARGQLQIQELTLASQSLQVYMDGNVGLNGSLRMNATASTSQLSANPTIARILFEQLPLATPVPIGVLTSANRFLADRVIYMQVSGSVRNPIIRVLPVPLLRDAAVRFFLERTVKGPSSNPAVGLSPK